MFLSQKYRLLVVIVSLLYGGIVFMQARLSFSAPFVGDSHESVVDERPNAKVAKAKPLAVEEKWLGTKGGTLSFSSKPITLQAPSGAVSEWIKIRQSDAQIENQEGLLEGFELTGYNTQKKPLTGFLSDVSLSISLQKYGTTEVAISWLNNKGQWVSLPTTIDKEKKVVTIKTSAVGTFALSKVESGGKTLPKDEPKSESLWLTREGGELKFQSKPVILDAPPDAVREDVLVKLSAASEIQQQKGFVELFKLEATNKEGRIITRFERHVTLMISLKENPFFSQKLNLSRLNEHGRWEHLPTTISAERTLAYTRIDSTGIFALLQTDFSSDRFWLIEEGGKLEFASRPVILDAPLKVVSEPVLVSLSVHRPPVGEEIFDGFTLTAQNDEGKALSNFERDVTLIVSFSQYKDQIPEDRTPALYKWDEKYEKWVYIPSQIDIDKKLLYAKQNDLGSFAIALTGGEDYGRQALPAMNGFNSDEFSGNSSYQLPLQMPRGPSSFGLQLGLSYSSEGANSLYAGKSATTEFVRQASYVGWGWSLSGLGQISHNLHDDSFFINYASGAFKLQDTTHGWQTDPQSFLKIKRSGDALWHVWDADGTRYTFGGDMNSDLTTEPVTFSLYTGPGCPRQFREAHLSEIKDRHGNVIKISYQREYKEVDLCNKDYVRAIRPMMIEYIPANVSPYLATVQVELTYSEDRPDILLKNSTREQVYYSNYRLTDMTMKVRDGDGANDLTTTNSYTLDNNHYDIWNTDPGISIMLLHSITEKGKNGGALPAWTFDYQREESETPNSNMLRNGRNGQGGRVRFDYQKDSEIPIEWCGSGNKTTRFRVTEMKLWDGLGNAIRHDYNATEPIAEGWDSHKNCLTNFQFAGYKYVAHEIHSEPVNGTPTHERTVETEYHQREGAYIEQRKGKVKWQQTKAPDGTVLQSVNIEWNKEEVLGVPWVHKLQQTVMIDGVSKTTGYDYDITNQGNAQYGNLTHVREFMNHDGSGTPYRTTETHYYPNDSGNNPDQTIYITNRPARQRLWAGNPNGTCEGDTVFSYDGQNYTSPPNQGLLTLSQVAQTDCNGTWSNTFYTYDDWGNQTSVTDPNGNTTTTSYDTSGEWPSLYAYPVSVTTPPASDGGTGLTTQYTWDKYVGQVISVKDPNHTEQNPVITNYQYDQWGRLLKMWKVGHDQDEPTQRFEYHNYVSDNAPFKVRQEQRSDDGSSVSYIEAYTFYDGLGREIQTRSTYINPDNQARHAVTFTKYNGLGLPSDVYAPIEEEASANYSGHNWNMNRPHTSTSYDALGRELDMTHPDGSLTAKRYGNETVNGQVFFKHSLIDANRHRKRSRIDALGRTHSVVEYTGNCANWEPGFECGGEYTEGWSDYAITTYNYDVASRLTGVTDNDGNQTTITYDLAGRKISMNDPDMGLWSYAYDDAGNLTRQTDARGQRICFYYDGLNRTTGKHYRNNNSCPSNPAFDVAYFYDQGEFGKGLRTSMIDLSGSTNWQIDARGRVTREDKTINGGGDFATQWTYDALDRVRTMTYPADNQGNLGEVVTYHYEDLHQAQLSTVDSNLNNGTAYATNMKYNIYGQLTSLQHRRSTPIVREYEYYDLHTENGLGRLQKIMTTAPNQELRQHLEYSYDAVGNVMSITDYMSGPQTQQFSYDELDRLVTASATGGSDGSYNELYDYDEIGNMYRPGQNYDYGAQSANCDAGALNQPHALVSQGSDSYCYDANGNMTSYVTPWGADFDLTYNAENQLATESSPDEALSKSLIYDGLGQRVKVTTTWDSGSELTIYYIGHDVEWVETSSGSVEMTKYYHVNGQLIALRLPNNQVGYILNDHLSSTSKLLKYNGDEWGEKRYMPYGQHRAGSGFVSNRNFTGQILDGGGLYFYGSRYYAPALGRFIQPDSIVPEPGNPQSLNRYSYVLNNPLRYTDPTGHCPAPPEGSGNVICVAGFIPTKTSTVIPDEIPVVGGYRLQGDNRGFSSNSAKDRSRFWAWIDADTGEIIEHYVHPTCDLDNDCWAPRTGNNKLVSRKLDDGSIVFSYSVVCSAPICYTAPGPEGVITFIPDENGSFLTRGNVEPFPNLEAYHWKNGQLQNNYLFRIQNFSPEEISRGDAYASTARKMLDIYAVVWESASSSHNLTVISSPRWDTNWDVSESDVIE